MIRYTHIIVENCAIGDNIYTYLKRHGYSENFLKNLRKEFGFIKLNDNDVFITEKIKNGDKISVNSNPNKRTRIEECFLPLNILYEDDWILIINKPSGIATMPTRSHYSNNLCGAISYYMRQKDDNFVVRTINRLDKDTSGIVIVAKDSLSANFLNNSNIDKTYYALLSGKIDEEQTIDKKISTSINEYGFNNNKRIICDNGKTAITHIYPIKYYEKPKVSTGRIEENICFDDITSAEKYTFCKVKIEYGRTHQIRIHSAYINHPLIGDELYGQKSNLISHSALFCGEVSFLHPKTKIAMSIKCDLPNDFKALVD